MVEETSFVARYGNRHNEPIWLDRQQSRPILNIHRWESQSSGWHYIWLKICVKYISLLRKRCDTQDEIDFLSTLPSPFPTDEWWKIGSAIVCTPFDTSFLTHRGDGWTPTKFLFFGYSFFLPLDEAPLIFWATSRVSSPLAPCFCHPYIFFRIRQDADRPMSSTKVV